MTEKQMLAVLIKAPEFMVIPVDVLRMIVMYWYQMKVANLKQSICREVRIKYSGTYYHNNKVLNDALKMCMEPMLTGLDYVYTTMNDELTRDSEGMYYSPKLRPVRVEDYEHDQKVYSCWYDTIDSFKIKDKMLSMVEGFVTSIVHLDCVSIIIAQPFNQRYFGCVVFCPTNREYYLQLYKCDLDVDMWLGYRDISSIDVGGCTLYKSTRVSFSTMLRTPPFIHTYEAYLRRIKKLFDETIDPPVYHVYGVGMWP